MESVHVCAGPPSVALSRRDATHCVDGRLSDLWGMRPTVEWRSPASGSPVEGCQIRMSTTARGGARSGERTHPNEAPRRRRRPHQNVAPRHRQEQGWLTEARSAGNECCD